MKAPNPKSLRWVGLTLMLAILLLTPLPSLSQSCALCYTQAASSGSRMIQALKSGILILIIPPTFMSVGLILVMRRKNNEVRDTDEKNRTESKEDW